VWHPQTGKALGIGHTALYTETGFAGFGYRRDAAYVTYDPETDIWSPWTIFDFPKTDNDKYYFNGVAGQFLVEQNGNILIPVYFVPPNMGFQLTGMVMRCTFDGEKLTYVEHGREMNHSVPRGLYEKSITYYGGKYYMTIRNDEKGFVTVSSDGLNYDPIRPWTFDDNKDLGSYNTQQKWVTHSDGLFLVYTRRGANNDHIIRHRAPLFMAQIDTVTLQVIRATERIVVPERGASLGNFAATYINKHETWVTVAGPEGPVYKARIIWSKDNIMQPTVGEVLQEVNGGLLHSRNQIKFLTSRQK
jgi:hypothetical protein